MIVKYLEEGNYDKLAHFYPKITDPLKEINDKIKYLTDESETL